MSSGFLRDCQARLEMSRSSLIRIADPAVSGGCFASYADPNSLLAVEQEDVEACCINGELVGGKSYRARWRGDTVTQIWPDAGTYPIFRRTSLDQDRVPVRPADVFVSRTEGPLVARPHDGNLLRQARLSRRNSALRSNLIVSGTWSSSRTEKGRTSRQPRCPGHRRRQYQ
jgi:hypothetical protein